MKKNYSFIEGWISIIGNIILFVLKYWAGIITGSVALIADSWHTLTDSVSSLIVIISAYISKKPADKDHPFGHGRADLVSSIIIGMLLVMIGFEFILKSIEQLKSGIGVNFGTLAIIVTIISILVKEGMAQYAFWAAPKNQFAHFKSRRLAPPYRCPFIGCGTYWNYIGPFLLVD
jgi:cation diffusion facilitator family transporter